MYIRKLTETDSAQLDNLIQEVEANLKNEKFWLPMEETAKNHFFDEDWTYFLGAFEDDELIGAVALFFNAYEYGESREILGIEDRDLAEYGRAMVKPSYQGQGIMKKLSAQLLDYGKSIGIKRVIATVHPDNIPSQTVVKSVGFEKKAFVTKKGDFDRDIFLNEI